MWGPRVEASGVLAGTVCRLHGVENENTNCCP